MPTLLALVCTNCKKPFTRLKSVQRKDSKNFFCSNKCQLEFLRLERVKKASWQVLSCEVCGERVKRKRWHRERFKHSFCSVFCRQKWIVNNILKVRKRKKIDLKCDECGKEFRRWSFIPILDHTFCSRDCVRSWKGKFFQSTNTRASLSQKNRVYQLNEKVFDDLNNEPSAYWLGFLAAEGCLTKGGNRLSLRISTKDHEHLAKFRTFLDSDYKIRVKKIKLGDKEFEICEIRVTSLHLADRLRSLGWVKGSDKELNLFRNIPDEFKRHFLRGFLDGDDTITSGFQKDKKSRFGKRLRTRFMFISSNKQFLEEVKNFIGKEIGTNCGYILKDKRRVSFYKLTYSTHHLFEKLSNFFYSDAKIFLARKKDSCNRILNEISAVK